MASGIKVMPAALAAGLLLMGAAAWLGGWPWALLMLAAVAQLPFSGGGAKEEALADLPALLWTALAAASGDRRLMFPYALQLAVTVACRTRLWGGIGVMALFAGIRWWQAATAHVLAVEMLAAAPAMAAGLWVYHWGPQGAEGRLLAGLAAAAVGLLGLLL